MGQGRAILSAATREHVPHLVFSSVAGADQDSGVPHFESKARIETELAAGDVPYTILGPTYFEEAGGSTDQLTIVLRERGLRRLTPLADASYGTVRLLGLLALLYDPDPPAFTCIEEIDHGLHPQALELVVQRLREAAERTQFIVATHSPALVNRLRPKEFVVCDRDDDGVSIIPALTVDEVKAIVEESGEQPLGELWFSGVLGGDLTGGEL